MGLPEENELAKLPLLRLVDYAARCACRILPYAQLHFEKADRTSVEQCVSIAMDYSEKSERFIEEADDFISHAKRAAANAVNESRQGAAAPLAERAAAAASAAAFAAEAAFTIYSDSAAADLHYHCVAYAEAAASFSDDSEYVAAARTDFESMLDRANTKISGQSVLPLWPMGKPEWYLGLVQRVAFKDSDATIFDADSSPVTMPTMEELATLPRRLIVAFAYRCAQRMFLFAELELENEIREVVKRAIGDTERFARNQIILNEQNWRKQSSEILSAARSTTTQSAAAQAAASAAFEAHSSAIGSVSSSTRAAAACADLSSADYYGNSDFPGSDSVSIRAARLDFAAFVELAKTSDSLSLGFPLWPEGEPQWYADVSSELNARKTLESEAEPGQFRINLSAPPGTSDEEIRSVAIQLAMALDEDYQEIGGEGLVVDNINIFDPSKVEVTQ